MKHDQYSGAAPNALRDLWIELELGPTALTASGGSAPPTASSGSGARSGGAGYGLGLVVPDRFSRERIERIMRDLCEQDRKKQ